MKPRVALQLRRVKQLHADRADTEKRHRFAALNAAIASRAAAEEALGDWRARMPALAEAIYQKVIGQVVSTAALDAVNAEVAALRTHESVLEQKLAEQTAQVTAASVAFEQAAAAAAAAGRAVKKFDGLIEVLRQVAQRAADRKEDAELEEAVELRFRAGEASQSGDTPEGDRYDGRHQAA